MKTNDEEFNNNHDKMMTGTETETDNHNHMTKTVVAVHDKHGTISEGPGDGYSAIQQGMQKKAQETSSTSLGL
jgi:hypothetical protein